MITLQLALRSSVRFSLRWTGFGLLAASTACATTPAPAARAPAVTVTAAPTSSNELAPPAPVQGSIGVSGSLLPPMPTAVTSFGAAADATHLYAIGGYFGEPHGYVREDQSAVVWRLALDGSQPWEQIGAMPHGLQGLGAVVYERRLCRFGGNHVENAKGQEEDLRSVAEATCFDLDARTWHALPDLPAGRSSLDVALLGSTVYVGGAYILTKLEITL